MLLELKKRKKKKDGAISTEGRSFAASQDGAFHNFGVNTDCRRSLEQIYAIEEVDVKTIKPMAKMLHYGMKQVRKKKCSFQKEQMSLNFGTSWSISFDPLYNHQSIDVLSLSLQAQKHLHKLGFFLIKDLVQSDLHSLVFQGMGQGHVDEVRLKLEEYIERQCAKEKKNKVDLYSLLGAISTYVDRQQWAVIVADYGLEHLLHLSAAELASIRYLSVEKKRSLRQECLAHIQSNVALWQFVLQKIESVVSIFIIPWMHKRHGLVYERDLMDRLYLISADCEHIPSLLQLLSDVFLSGKNILQYYLMPVEKDLFAADRFVAMLYQKTISLAHEYFYSPEVEYEFDCLLYFLQRQLVRRWENIDANFIRRALLYCSAFVLYYSAQDVLLIHI